MKLFPFHIQRQSPPAIGRLLEAEESTRASSIQSNLDDLTKWRRVRNGMGQEMITDRGRDDLVAEPVGMIRVSHRAMKSASTERLPMGRRR